LAASCENAKIMYGRMKDSTDRTSGVSESIPVGTQEERRQKRSCPSSLIFLVTPWRLFAYIIDQETKRASCCVIRKKVKEDLEKVYTVPGGSW
jgi:hypothetical protein